MSVCVCLVSVCACLHVFVSLCVVICPSPFCIPPVLQIKQFFLGYGGVSIVLPFIRPGKVGATSTQPAMYCHPTQFCLSMCDFLCCLHISLSHSAAGLWTFICCSPQNQVPHIHILHTLHACLTLTGAHTTYASYNTYTASHHTLTTQTTSHHKLPLTPHTTAHHTLPYTTHYLSPCTTSHHTLTTQTTPHITHYRTPQTTPHTTHYHTPHTALHHTLPLTMHYLTPHTHHTNYPSHHTLPHTTHCLTPHTHLKPHTLDPPPLTQLCSSPSSPPCAATSGSGAVSR